MNVDDVRNIFRLEDIRDLPDAIMKILFGEKNLRDNIYRTLLEKNNYDMSYDWFQCVYEETLSEGKRKGQHFTPIEIGQLLAKLVNSGKKSSIHEPTAGNGLTIITEWWEWCSKKMPYEVFPWDHPVLCYELSSRSLPILLLNMSIRGIVGVVCHGDVIENKAKNIYVLRNENNDALAFSDIIKLPGNDI